MSYQALARKWRPRRFSELVGQEHVVRALSHALDSDRLHHAFLFTGTRGVGKTTIARILAKSLNCERGASSDPCGECSACVAIDEGRFVDLLEIDAASNTGVDNVRDLIENAQYAPANGRYKVYLIDEVHMLSKPAFNALLKILEEPPRHVKFLLATTDPQKLLVTVLSRCIKFSLKRLTPEQIEGQMRRILDAEGIAAEAEALAALARGADGSLRDGLSLLDQAIAHGGGELSAAEVHAMLGTVERARVQELLTALAAGDGAALLAEVERIAALAPDFGQVLDELAGLLHGVQVQQLVPGASSDAGVAALADTIDPQDVQLWYQMAITGRRDLELAPTARTGFEMALLRMLAFVPETAVAGEGAVPRATQVATPAPARTTPVPAARPPSPVPTPPAPSPERSPAAPRPNASPPPAAPATLASAADWNALVDRAGLGGPVGQLAANATLTAHEGDVLRLAFQPPHDQLASGPLLGQLEQRIGEALGRRIRIQVETGSAAAGPTPAELRARDAEARQAAAEEAILADPGVRAMMDTFDAELVPGSVRPPEP